MMSELYEIPKCFASSCNVAVFENFDLIAMQQVPAFQIFSYKTPSADPSPLNKTILESKNKIK